MTQDEALSTWDAVRAAEEVASYPWWRLNPPFLQEAAFLMAIINLLDALKLLSRAGERIDFRDDIPGDRDITDLVYAVRNAACHVDSAHRHIPNGTAAFQLFVGAMAARFGDVRIENPYDDDIAIFYGTTGIFAMRHIQRAIREAKDRTLRIAKAEGHWLPGAAL